MQLITRKQMQWLDRMAIEKRGIPSLALMENAGREVARVIGEHVVSAKGGTPLNQGDPGLRRDDKRGVISIFCGKGNNGGDGLVIARLLHGSGCKVKVYLLAHPQDYRGDPLVNLNRLPCPYDLLLNEKDLKLHQKQIQKSSLLVDAIFGTGLDRPIQGFTRKLIRFLNQTEIPICAVDIPSGVDATTGEVLGESISASLTVTFHLPKRGLVLGSAVDRVGELKVVDIGIPYVTPAKAWVSLNQRDSRFHGNDKREFLITPELFSHFFKPRQKKSHKNVFGHVLTIAGSKRKMGAALMTARAALRTGAGLSTLALPEIAYRKIDRKYSEVMFEPQKDDGEFFSAEALPILLKLIPKKSVVACGPGLGVSKDLQKIIGKLIRHSKVPLVLDADALNVLSLDLSLLKKHRSPIVLTPHPGEMKRLLKSVIPAKAEISRVHSGDSRSEACGNDKAIHFAKKYNLYLILKGYRSLVICPNGDLYVNPTGNPGMATAGAGDVLTGIIAGLIAQKIPLPEAILAGVWIHGKAGDQVAKRKGERGIVAWDIAEEVPFVLREITES